MLLLGNGSKDMKEKIEQLLKSQQAENNLLAFELLQSQLKQSAKEALLFIFESQIQYIEEEDSSFTLDFQSTLARFYFLYEYDPDYGMEHAELVLELLQKEKSIRKEKIGK